MALKLVYPFVLCVASIYADVYLQNPKGSNDRLNGRNRDRGNAQRLFDSENNARGGYNEDGLVYHSGSQLSIEWTNQHSCSGTNNNCELVLQYMCSPNLRNGRQETTIRFPKNQCIGRNCNTDARYGMQEDYSNYLSCITRSRNKGLFRANQNMNGRNTAKYTRQANNGQRHGYECPEERDYYPYWASSPWKDIAVMTSDTTRCNYYKAESQNVKAKFECRINYALLGSDNRWENQIRARPVPLTQAECQRYRITVNTDRGRRTLTGQWTRMPAHGIPAPDCITAPPSRDNHNGNGVGAFPNTYNWTIPNDVNENCAMRIRYNISSGDYTWNTFSNSDRRGGMIVGSQSDIASNRDARLRDYRLRNNPRVRPLKIGGAIQYGFRLRLAINTAQFGRTFQDRTHKFSIRSRPANIPANANIYNLNVRGKRGNIVQTYPATEYDFVPMRLNLKVGDAVHIQWNGSDNNPRNNDGEGRKGTDRSNMILLRDPAYNAVKNAQAKTSDTRGHWGNSYPKKISANANSNILGLSSNDAIKLAFSGQDVTTSTPAPPQQRRRRSWVRRRRLWGDQQSVADSRPWVRRWLQRRQTQQSSRRRTQQSSRRRTQQLSRQRLANIALLNNAGTYFNLGPRVVRTPGIFNTFCTRNNNFSNRGQKGQIVVGQRNNGDEEEQDRNDDNLDEEVPKNTARDEDISNELDSIEYLESDIEDMLE